MKIKFTRAPTITKAAIATVLFTILWAATNVDLPSCSDPGAALNPQGCVVHQSYLHVVCGFLALASLITGVVLFILRQRKVSAQNQRAAPRPARSEAPRPTRTTVPEMQAHGDATGPVTASGGLSRSPGGERASNFCRQCGTRAVAGDHFCQQCGAPVKNGTRSYPQNTVVN
jgi:hypothetical protein